jgi:hypothetical protein
MGGTIDPAAQKALSEALKMMGTSWRKDPEHVVDKKFAWLPIKTTSNKRVWLKQYIEVNVYMDTEMAHPIRSNTWTYRYTKNEYLIKQLQN